MGDWEFEEEVLAAQDDMLTMDQFSPIKQIQQMELYHWGVFVVGAFLFISAKTVAHRAATFYISGAVFGVIWSVLFLALFIRRFLPKVSKFYLKSIYLLIQLLFALEDIHDSVGFARVACN